MDLQQYVIGFMEMVAEDPRIGPSHISLFMAILHFYQLQGRSNPVRIYARELRVQAKISSPRNYYCVMGDLRNWGYLKLTPSFNHLKPSEVLLRRF